MSKPLITIRNVCKHYGKGPGKQQVLHNVDVDIRQGELVSIVGTSGSGKSTLLNIIGGLDRIYEGEVHVLGHAYTGLSDNRLSRLRNNRIGFVFQSFNLLDHLTCWENVALPAFFGRHPGDAQKAAKENLERVGLEAKVNIKPGSLSGGQKQRVAIARALFNKPELLLCDEPTGNLDTKTGQQIIDLFSSLNKNMGITVIIVTHELRVSRVADRRIRLEDGRVASNEGGDEHPPCGDAAPPHESDS
ncbi:MAG: ABC transporter ATP-binding protein [bacterium]